MKHVMSRLGDQIPEEDLNQFFSMLENGSEYINVEQVVKVLKPQTSKDLYSKDVPSKYDF
jgi:hypothetical protein